MGATTDNHTKWITPISEWQILYTFSICGSYILCSSIQSFMYVFNKSIIKVKVFRGMKLEWMWEEGGRERASGYMEYEQCTIYNYMKTLKFN